MLPIATKPLIDYTLDTFLLTGINEIIVVISANAEYIEHHLGNGEHWGVQLNYVLSRGQEEPTTVLARLGSPKHLNKLRFAQLFGKDYVIVRLWANWPESTNCTF